MSDSDDSSDHSSTSDPFDSDSVDDLQAGVDRNDYLKVGGLNVHSLLVLNGDRDKKREVDRLIRRRRRHNLDIVVLGETWLPGRNRTAAAINERLPIANYSYVRQDRTFHGGYDNYGGLIVYIRNNIRYTVGTFWEWPENKVQFLEISITHPARFDLVAIYSPHKKHAQYVTDLMKFFLQRNQDSLVPVMFVGDLNIDPARNDDRGELANLREHFGTRCLITTATHQRSCIDHIITNIPDELMIPVNTNVIPTSKTHTIEKGRFISHHNLVLCKVRKIPQLVVEPQLRGNENVSLKCLYCPEVDRFASGEDLQAHIRREHVLACGESRSPTHDIRCRPTPAMPANNGNNRCPKCVAAFATVELLTQHINDFHRCHICHKLLKNPHGRSIHHARMHRHNNRW